MAAAAGAAAAAAAAAIVAAAAVEAAEIDLILLCCGFNIAQQRLDISRDGFVGYADINILREKDISDLAKLLLTGRWLMGGSLLACAARTYSRLPSIGHRASGASAGLLHSLTFLTFMTSSGRRLKRQGKGHQ